MGFWVKDAVSASPAPDAGDRTARAPDGSQQIARPPISNARSGHRFYSPGMGRWVSRDPIGEMGGINLLGHVSNRATDLWDILGLDDKQPPPCKCIVYLWLGHFSEIRRELGKAKNRDERGCIKHIAVACDVSQEKLRSINGEFGLSDKEISQYQMTIYNKFGGFEPPVDWVPGFPEVLEGMKPIHEMAKIFPGLRDQRHLSWIYYMRNMLKALRSGAVRTGDDMAKDEALKTLCNCRQLEVVVRKVSGVNFVSNIGVNWLSNLVAKLGEDGNVIHSIP